MADTQAVIKSLSLISLVCALAIGGWMWTRQSFQSTDQAPTAILQAATAALELNHRVNGTYAGFVLDGVTLVSADTLSYCLETGGYFVSGPGGTPAPGSCPQ